MSRSSAESRPSSAGSEEPGLDVPAGDGFVARLERAVAPHAHRFAEAPAVRALRSSLPIAFVVAFVTLGALVLVPLPHGFGALAARVRDGLPVAFSLASFAMVPLLAFALAARLEFPRALAVAAASIAFVLALPRDAVAALAGFVRSPRANGTEAFAATLGASGIFTAIVVCLATAAAFALSRRAYGARAGSVTGALTIVLASGALYALRFSVAGALAHAVAPLADLGDSFGALFVITALESVLWLIGVHGSALLAAIILPVYLNLQAQNFAAHGAHQPLAHIVVISTFLFVFPGGSGATLPLMLMLLRSRVPRLRTFAYATVLPSLANVNDPVIFGLPIAYNPYLAVPFVLAPVVLCCTTYAALALGLVAKPVIYVPSMVPAFVNVFIATLDWRACVLVAVNVAIAGAIWLPFIRVYERAELARLARPNEGRA